MPPLRLRHQPGGGPHQDSVLPDADDVPDPVVLAPAEHPPAAEPGVGAQHDLHLGPALAKRLHQHRQHRPGVLRPVDAARPQVRHQQVPAAEHVQRQVAVVAVVAVEEALLLSPVQARVRRVEVQHQPARRHPVRRHELLEQLPVDGQRRVPVGAPLHPAQRRRARQLGIPAHRRAQRQVVPQLRMAVQVLLPQRQRVHPLAQHLHHRVAPARLPARIPQTPGHRLRQPDLPVHLRQQLDAAVPGDLPAAELALDPAAQDGGKSDRGMVTFRHGGFSCKRCFNTLILQGFPPSFTTYS